MKKFIKKRIEIGATQVTSVDFEGSHPNHVPGVTYDPINEEVYVDTLEGRMTGRIGDWIIRGIKGELYICKDDIFRASYDESQGDRAEQPRDRVVEAVRADLLRRSQLGIQKYGMTLERDDLTLKQWLQHAYEECLDQANYLKRVIIEIEKGQEE